MIFMMMYDDCLGHGIESSCVGVGYHHVTGCECYILYLCEM